VLYATIVNCWLQSRVLAPKIGPQTKQEAERTGWREDLKVQNKRYDTILAQIKTAIQALAELQHIEEAMSVTAFINPAVECVEDNDEEDLQQVIEQVAEAYSQEETLADPDEIELVAPQPVKIADALASLATLRLYEEQQEDGSREVVRNLNRLERQIRGRQASRSTQKTLDGFLIANQSASM
jgi:hypothetical protein